MDNRGPTSADLAERAFARHEDAFAGAISRTLAGKDDADPVHDLRVAARRIRACLRTFASLVPARDKNLPDSLRRILKPAGRVRDLDVQLERLRNWRAEFDLEDDVSLESIAGLLRRRREPARKVLERELERPRTAALLRILEDLPDEVRRAEPQFANLAAAIGAPPVIVRAHRRFVKAGSLVGPDRDPEALHDLRIACKRFRYTLESFDLLYAGAAPLLRRAAALQDLLGDFHDGEVAARDLQSFSTHPSTGVSASSAFLLGRLAERHRAEQQALLEAFPQAYARLSGSRWRRLKDEMRHERRREKEEHRRGRISRPARHRLGA